jgi:ACS family sodium-dependent inorganic phosphate cotransporter
MNQSPPVSLTIGSALVSPLSRAIKEPAKVLSAAGAEQAGRGEWLGPLRALARRKEVWAICVAQYCGSWGLYGLISWLPTYFTDQFGVSMADLPAFTFLPYLIQGGVGLGVGALADNLLERGWSRLLVRRVMQVAGMVAPAAALLAAVSLAGESSVQTAAILVVRARTIARM